MVPGGAALDNSPHRGRSLRGPGVSPRDSVSPVPRSTLRLVTPRLTFRGQVSSVRPKSLVAQAFWPAHLLTPRLSRLRFPKMALFRRIASCSPGGSIPSRRRRFPSPPSARPAYAGSSKLAGPAHYPDHIANPRSVKVKNSQATQPSPGPALEGRVAQTIHGAGTRSYFRLLQTVFLPPRAFGVAERPPEGGTTNLPVLSRGRLKVELQTFPSCREAA